MSLTGAQLGRLMEPTIHREAKWITILETLGSGHQDDWEEHKSSQRIKNAMSLSISQLVSGAHLLTRHKPGGMIGFKPLTSMFFHSTRTSPPLSFGEHCLEPTASDVVTAYRLKTMSELYTYDPLPAPRSVRLLQILSDESSEYKFSLRLRTYALDDIPPFRALSYTWGSPDFPEDDDDDAGDGRTHNIKCDGRDLEVGENLADFLRQMNDDMLAASTANAPSSSGRLGLPERSTNFWIDAVCIDQQNSDERLSQVRLMGEIYQSASTVVAWLGRTEPNRNARWVLAKFAPYVLDLEASARGSEMVQVMIETGHELRSRAAARILGERVCERWRRSYVDFFAFFAGKRWLTRGWVVQEAAIPDEDAVVLQCGRQRFSWSDVNQFCSFITSVGWNESLNPLLGERLGSWRKRPGTLNRLCNPPAETLPSFQDEELDDHIVDWQNWRWGATTDEEVRHAEVLHTFHRLRFYEFSNPLDHIFGALGLIDRILGPRYELGITPSYDVSVQAMFTDVTSWLLGHLPNLDILGLAGLSSNRPGSSLPSWVPDFAFHGPKHCTSLQRVRQRTKYCRRARPFDATDTAGEVRRPFASVRGSELVLEGACCDKILRAEAIEQDDKGMLVNLGWVLELCTRDGTYDSSGQTYCQAVAETLCAEARPSGISDEAFEEMLEGWIWDCVGYDQLWGKNRHDQSRRENTQGGRSQTRAAAERPGFGVSSRSLQDQLRSRLEDNPITKIVQFVVPGRQVLETERGLLGLGPPETQLGDQVWLVNGGRMPLLLRRLAGSDGAGEKYLLVGEVLVHGIMYGEMEDQNFRSKFGGVVLV